MSSSTNNNNYQSVLFTGPTTFMNVPHSVDPKGSLAAIIGVPFDAGTSAERVGSRGGPSAIRQQSLLLDHYQPPQTTYSPIEKLNLIDCGDVTLVPSVVETSLQQAEAAALSEEIFRPIVFHWLVCLRLRVAATQLKQLRGQL